MKSRKSEKYFLCEDELLTEYKFDYTKAKPNRFASKVLKGIRVIVLDSDVAKVFKTNESVNSALRLVMRERQTTKRRKVAIS